jgi:hypothetical protein
MANMGIPHEAIKVAIADSVQWLFFIKRDGAIRKVSEVCRVHDYDRAKGEYVLEKF